MSMEQQLCSIDSPGVALLQQCLWSSRGAVSMVLAWPCCSNAYRAAVVQYRWPWSGLVAAMPMEQQWCSIDGPGVALLQQCQWSSSGAVSMVLAWPCCSKAYGTAVVQVAGASQSDLFYPADGVNEIKQPGATPRRHPNGKQKTEG